MQDAVTVTATPTSTESTTYSQTTTQPQEVERVLSMLLETEEQVVVVSGEVLQSNNYIPDEASVLVFPVEPAARRRRRRRRREAGRQLAEEEEDYDDVVLRRLKRDITDRYTDEQIQESVCNADNDNFLPYGCQWGEFRYGVEQ